MNAGTRNAYIDLAEFLRRYSVHDLCEALSHIVQDRGAMTEADRLDVRREFLEVFGEEGWRS